MLAFVMSAPVIMADSSDAGIMGTYSFTASRNVVDDMYEELLPASFIFTITGSEEQPVLNGFFDSSALSLSYDPATRCISLKANTLRFGRVGDYTYLGLASNQGQWLGMGVANTTFPSWTVNDDGTIAIPDFTVVDYSTYNPTSNQPATVVASFSDVTAVPVTEDADAPDDNSFAGTYTFKVTQTCYPVDGFSEDDSVTEDYTLTFTINRYNQIWTFDGYTQNDMYLNTLRNKGYVMGDTFIIDMDSTNGTLWEIDKPTDTRTINTARLFGGTGNTWDQGQRAFTVTRNSDGSFTLSPLSLFLRFTIEDDIPGAAMQTYRDIVLLKRWQNPRFVSSDVQVVLPDTQHDSVRYFNLQGVEVTNPGHGIFIKVQGGRTTKVRF